MTARPHNAPLSMPAGAVPARVEEIRRALDPRNTMAVVTFGREAGQKVVDVVEQVLAQARARDAGDAGEALMAIVQKAKGLDPASLERKGGILGLFSTARSRLERYKSEFDTVAGQFDAIHDKVGKEIAKRTRNVAFLDMLYEETLASIREFDAYIVAGRLVADGFEAVEIRDYEAAVGAAPVDSSDRFLAVQELQDARNALSALRDRIHRLDQGKMLSIQRLEEIRQQQAGDRSLVAMLSDARDITIREWKAGIALALGLDAQRQALELKAGITDANNAILSRNAQMLKGNAIRIEEESKRGIVDVDTIRQRNAILIETIEGVQKARRDGEESQKGFQATMVQLANELGDAVVKGAGVASRP